MSFLLDTNILSELRKGAHANHGLRSWIADVPETHIYLSILVIGEIRCGIERLRHRDPAQARALDAWLERVRDSAGSRVLELDIRVADVWGRWQAARPRPVIDGLLAAQAYIHDLTLVTRNVKDVSDTTARVLNPFAE